MQTHALAIMVLFIESIANDHCDENCEYNCYHQQAQDVMYQLISGGKLKELESKIEQIDAAERGKRNDR